MKKFIVSILAILGISTNAGAKTEVVDINTILYSMPTISGDPIEYIIPTEESFKNAPQFHEDDWCQLEFYPKSRLIEIQNKMSEYKVFEVNNRAASGWKNIFVRKISRNPFNLSIKELSTLDHSQVQPSPILTTASNPLGQVKNGFTISIGNGALLYGIKKNEKIVSLAASVYSDQGNSLLTSAFMNLGKTEELILVDWRGQMIITGSIDGKLNVWKP